MKRITTQTLYEATPLVSGLIADRLLAPATNDAEELKREDWICYLIRRADFHFQYNKNFNKLMRGKKCREWLECFIQHWIDAGERERQRWLVAVDKKEITEII